MYKIDLKVFIMKKIIFIYCLALQIALSGSSDTAKAEIVHRLEQWPRDFNAKNIPAVCGLFAEDLIASYPETTDKNYETMCHKLTETLTRQDRIFFYDAPQIQQVLIQDDIAVVRLIWTLKISDPNGLPIQIIKEKGLDVFKKQQEGTWKIVISYAYPII